MPERGRYLPRLLWTTLAALFLIAAWQTIPLVQSVVIGWRAEPRTIAPRGDLAEDERSTIELFEAARVSVVFIATTERVFSPWARNALNVPRGTGSGLVWDEVGHVVTNHHVVAGASEATVRLADGRAFGAALVGASPAHDLAVLRIGVGINRPPSVVGPGRQQRRPPRRAKGLRDRKPLRPGLDADHRHRLRPEPRTAGRNGRGDGRADPDRCRDQPRQLRGAAARQRRAADRREHGHLQPVGRQRRDRLRRPRQRGEPRGAEADRRRALRPTRARIRTEAQLNDALSARLGVRGVFVLDVAPGSAAAAAAGIRPARLTSDGAVVPGDIITVVAGEPVSRVPELLAALERLQVGAVVGLTIERGGQRLDVDVVLQPAG